MRNSGSLILVGKKNKKVDQAIHGCFEHNENLRLRFNVRILLECIKYNNKKQANIDNFFYKI